MIERAYCQVYYWRLNISDNLPLSLPSSLHFPSYHRIHKRYSFFVSSSLFQSISFFVSLRKPQIRAAKNINKWLITLSKKRNLSTKKNDKKEQEIESTKTYNEIFLSYRVISRFPLGLLQNISFPNVQL